MLIAGAVCPHPPLLIPAALGSASTDPPEELRKVAGAAAQAVSWLAGTRPDLIVVVGGGAAEREYGAGASGGLHAFGVGVTVGAGEPVLPLSLTVGRWLLERAGVLARGGVPDPAGLVGAGAGLPGETAPGLPAESPVASLPARPPAAGPGGTAVLFQEVARRATAGDCLKLGRILANRALRVALLAMGDSCARPAMEEPGAPDLAAQDYDEEVAEALAAADARWLARLDPALDDELVVAGRAAWQVLAGAAGGTRMQGRLLCMSAPYGVTYLVATWEQSRTD